LVRGDRRRLAGGEGEPRAAFGQARVSALTRVCLAETPDIRLRDVAERVGITERAPQRILAELVEAGYVKTTRVGRRNPYTVDHEHAMRHTAQIGHEIGELLNALTQGTDRDASQAFCSRLRTIWVQRALATSSPSWNSSAAQKTTRL